MSEAQDPAKEAYLRAHIEARHAIQVESLQRLDRGVFAARLADGRQWIVRIFPPQRPVERVQEDAALLGYLEQQGFAAERCADAHPVSTLASRGVLVTRYIEGTAPDRLDVRTLRAAGEMLARLNMLSADDPALAREAGALHHYVPTGGGPRHELLAAAAWLAAIEDQVPPDSRAGFDALRRQVAGADACLDLPLALIHPDPVPKNLLRTTSNDLVFIDWSGAGRGPRLAALANLVWSCALQQGGWSPTRVDAVVAGYRSRLRLEEREVERLGAVMRIRTVVFACWRYRYAVASGRPPNGTEWWWPSDELTQAVAARACAAFAH